MARTVAASRIQEILDASLPRASRWRFQGARNSACGFCTDLTREGVRHDFCQPEIGKWHCQCAAQGHQEAR